MPFDPYEGLEPDEPPRPRSRPNGAAEAERRRAAAAFVPLRLPDLEGKDPPRRRFIVQDLVPAGCVTSLYGAGGIGKSFLAQLMGTAVALGRPLYGFEVEKGPVLALMCEDDDEELWRRQVRINDWFGCRMADLGDLHLQGRAGLENMLAVYPVTGAPRAEVLHEVIREAARERKPGVIFLDPISHLFGGNENDRFQVTHFVNVAFGIAREFDCGVVLLGHPAKPQDSEWSGSTAWSASVRSRLLLQRVKDEENALLLSWPKVNYAKEGELALRWSSGGVLVPAAAKLMTHGDRLEADAREAAAGAAFLAALDRLTAQGRNVSHSKYTHNYAPKALAGLCNGFRERELAAAMENLLERGAIVANAKLWKGSDRKPVHGLARVARSEPGP